MHQSRWEMGWYERRAFVKERRVLLSTDLYWASLLRNERDGQRPFSWLSWNISLEVWRVLPRMVSPACGKVCHEALFLICPTRRKWWLLMIFFNCERMSSKCPLFVRHKKKMVIAQEWRWNSPEGCFEPVIFGRECRAFPLPNWDKATELILATFSKEGRKMSTAKYVNEQFCLCSEAVVGVYQEVL